MEFRVRIPFVEWLGFELLRFEPASSQIAVETREELTNSWGVTHGGVTMTLLDVAMAHAARAPATPGGEAQPGVVTVEMKTTFVRPGQGRLLAEGKLLHRTATLAFCEGSVRDSSGALVGHGTGTFKYLRGLPVDGSRRKVQMLNASD
jgi:uncharacterized protein (TIGR00369 family)